MKHIEWNKGKCLWLFNWMKFCIGIHVFTKYNRWFKFNPQFSWQYPNDRLKKRYIWREEWEFTIDIEILKIGFELALYRWYRHYWQCDNCEKTFAYWDKKSAEKCHDNN